MISLIVSCPKTKDAFPVNTGKAPLIITSDTGSRGRTDTPYGTGF